METIDGNISGELLKKVYFADKNTATKLFSKLKDNHFEYDTFEKMRVCLAVQILSESVAKGLEHAVKSKFFKKESENKVAHSTIIFVRKMNILFDIMNAKSIEDCNENKRGISKRNIDYLSELYKYITTIKQINGSTVYWIEGLKQTVNGTIGLFYQCHNQSSDFVLLTRLFNQDPLENLFGQVRARGKNNRNPYLLDFLRTISRIITSNILMTPKNTNCELDESSTVKVLEFEILELLEEDCKPV